MRKIMLLACSILLAACGTLEVGIEPPQTLPQTAVSARTPTPLLAQTAIPNQLATVENPDESTSLPSMTPTEHTISLFEPVAHVGNHAGYVAVLDHFVYMSSPDGVMVWEFTDPAHPVLLNQFSVGESNFVVALAASPNSLYTISLENCQGEGDCDVAFKVWGLDNRSQPVEQGQYTWRLTPQMPWTVRMATTAQVVYVADAGLGLITLDVTDPMHPVETSRKTGLAWSAVVKGNFLHVLFLQENWQGGFWAVFDITHPNAPLELASIPQEYDGSAAPSLIVVENTAYVVNGRRGIEIVDISEPTQPLRVGHVAVPTVPDGCGAFTQAIVVGQTLFANLDHCGGAAHSLRRWDITVPSNPQEMGFYEYPTGVSDMTVLGGYLLTARTASAASTATGDEGGLFVFRVDGEFKE